MGRPAKNLLITFEDAMAVHVMRAMGATYSELCLLLGEHSTRVTQILEGELHQGSWEAALERLEQDDYWHPSVIDLADKFEGSAPLIAATKAAAPAARRHRRTLKRLRKITIPYSRAPSRLIARRA